MDIRYSGGGGGCISRYGVGGGGGYHGRYAGASYGGCGSLYDISMVMMTKFRPIAPKPAASVSGSGDSTAHTTQGKRKYVKVKSFNKNSKKRKVVKSPERANSCGGERVVTLPLMPETPDRKENNHQTVLDSRVSSLPTLLSFTNNNHETSLESRTYLSHEIYGSATCPSYKLQTVSYMTVEQVTQAKVDSGLVGWREMENDTCPRFVTDNDDRVVWCNKAYKETVGGCGDVVAVREHGRLPTAFTCNVKVTCRGGMGCSMLTVPCDAWRLEGGYAWRLDVKAALCLGR